jgi:hypothetical protein
LSSLPPIRISEAGPLPFPFISILRITMPRSPSRCILGWYTNLLLINAVYYAHFWLTFRHYRWTILLLIFRPIPNSYTLTISLYLQVAPCFTPDLSRPSYILYSPYLTRIKAHLLLPRTKLDIGRGAVGYPPPPRAVSCGSLSFTFLFSPLCFLLMVLKGHLRIFKLVFYYLLTYFTLWLFEISVSFLFS